MNSKRVKLRMLERDIKAIHLSRRLGVPYDRLIRILGGFRKATRPEAEAIADAIGFNVEDLEARLLPDKDGGSQVA